MTEKELQERARELRNEYQRKWRRQNRDKILEYQRKWRKKNKDKIKASKDRYWLKKAAEAVKEGNKKH